MAGANENGFEHRDRELPGGGVLVGRVIRSEKGDAAGQPILGSVGEAVVGFAEV